MPTTVHALAAGGSRIYAGGKFITMGWSARERLAAIDSNGKATDWNPGADGMVKALAVRGSTIYAGGYFSHVGADSTYRRFLAAFNATTGAVTDWAPHPNSQVQALATDGSTLYVGGSFVAIGGATRNHIAAFDSNGNVTNWDPNANDDVFAFAISDSTVYAGGSFTTVGQYIAGIDSDGAATTWDASAYYHVYALAAASNRLCAGGGFRSVGNYPNAYFARFDGAALPTLNVTKSGSGSGTVTSDPSGIDCGSTCSASYSEGTVVTLTVAPASGSIFTGWSGGCSGTGTCTVAMTEDISVTASFGADTICTYTFTPKNKKFAYKAGTVTVNITGKGQKSCPTPSVFIPQGEDWLSLSSIAFAKNKGKVTVSVT